MNHEESLRLSDDGSHTIYSNKYKAHYHSLHGALDESIHVFIIAGLYKFVCQGYKKINIFEMGFGTGLNALLSLLEARKFDVEIHYNTIESDPLDLDKLKQLNYSELLSCPNDLLYRLHKSGKTKSEEIDKAFFFRQYAGKIEDYSFEGKFDLIYWDAFAPECQSDLWEKDIHQKVYNSLNDYGILVSYCTKGSFKRVLKDIGYSLETLSGPGKKREMLRAIKVT